MMSWVSSRISKAIRPTNCSCFLILTCRYVSGVPHPRTHMLRFRQGALFERPHTIQFGHYLTECYAQTPASGFV